MPKKYYKFFITQNTGRSHVRVIPYIVYHQMQKLKQLSILIINIDAKDYLRLTEVMQVTTQCLTAIYVVTEVQFFVN